MKKLIEKFDQTFKASTIFVAFLLAFVIIFIQTIVF
jgi:hypothetical protein